MAQLIDITDFNGVTTFADVEDLPDIVAQNMENLRILSGKLEKTFGAGQPSDIPSFPKDAVETEFTGTWTVYNIFTFVSDKFTTNEYRYILVLISDNNVARFFWWDPSLPDVSDTLQITDTSLFFTTASSNGISTADSIIIQSTEDNLGASIGQDVYKSPDAVSGNKVYINTDATKAWHGGLLGQNPYSDGTVANQSFGGKDATHLLVDGSVGVGGTDYNTINDIAIVDTSGEALMMAITDSNRQMVYSKGSVVTDMSATYYNSITDASTYTTTITGLFGFNNAIYVHYSASKILSGALINNLYKYALDESGNITESSVGSMSISSASSKSYWYKGNNGKCYVLAQDLGLYEINTSDTVTSLTLPTQTSGMEWCGLATVVQEFSAEPKKEYIFIAETSSTQFKIYYRDILDESVSTFTGGYYIENNNNYTWSGQLFGMTSVDFGQENGESESLILNYVEESSGNYSTKVKYSLSSDSSGYIFDLWDDVDVVNFAPETTTSTTSTISLVQGVSSPNGSYLMVGKSSLPLSGTLTSCGALYQVTGSYNGTYSTLSTALINQQGLGNYDKGWKPTCFAGTTTGVVAGNQFYAHAKAFIGVYGTESSDGSTPLSTIFRCTDIGWKSGTWNGSGDCEYRWIDLIDKYDLTDTYYHAKDQNPIIPFSDSIRFNAGAIGQVSSTEGKGVWLGYIDRSVFNGLVTHGPDFFAYTNNLSNPFSFTAHTEIKTNNALRAGDSVKYNLTAVYDGVQETLFDKSKEKLLNDTDINKNIVELDIGFDANAISKRITGINIYRSIGTTGTYDNWQLLGHMTFVDTQEAMTAWDSSNTTGQIEFTDNNIFYIDTDDSITDNDYTESLLGANAFALFTADGMDGIDSVASDGGVYVDLGTNQRKVGVEPTFIVLNTSTGITDGLNITVGSEIMTIDTTADPDTTLTGNGYDGYSTISDIEGVPSGLNLSDLISAGDVLQFGRDDSSIDESVTIASVGTTTLTLTAPLSNSHSTSPHNMLFLMTPAGTDAVYSVTRGASSTTARSHNIGDTVLKTQSTGYYKVTLDTNADIGNAYLDGSSFIGDDWKIKRRLFGGTYTTASSEGGFTGSSGGCFGGKNVARFSTDDTTITENSLVGTLIKFGSKTYEIEANGAHNTDINGVWLKTVEEGPGNATYFNAMFLSNYAQDDASGATTPGVGFIQGTGTNVTVRCQDYQLEDLGESAVQTVYSNRVNGQYARLLKGRLFLGNIYLNPDDKAEERSDWVAYSELNQFDSTPVSNVMTFEDREGGSITGIADLFGRLVVFKPQAIFVVNIVDPMYPASWAVAESKHNIGNIAPKGFVQVHDSIYFVYHDGIYILNSNTVASSTATPSIMGKVSLDIEDQFLLADDKTAVKGFWDINRQEVIYTWEASSVQVIWAYHIQTKTWRKIDMTGALDVLDYDENGSPMSYDRTNNNIIMFDTSSASSTKWKSKRFPLNLHRKELIREMTLQYTGTDALTANVYLDGSASADFTQSISSGTTRFPVKRYAHRMEVELTSPSSTNNLTIERIQIEIGQ